MSFCRSSAAIVMSNERYQAALGLPLSPLCAQGIRAQVRCICCLDADKGEAFRPGSCRAGGIQRPLEALQ